MELKITKDKNARWNKMLLFLTKLGKYAHLAWFLLSIWPIWPLFLFCFFFWGGGRFQLSPLSSPSSSSFIIIIIIIVIIITIISLAYVAGVLRGGKGGKTSAWSSRRSDAGGSRKGNACKDVGYTYKFCFKTWRVNLPFHYDVMLAAQGLSHRVSLAICAGLFSSVFWTARSILLQA